MCTVMASQQPVLTLVAAVFLCTSPTFLLCSFCCRKFKNKLPRPPGVMEEARARARRRQKEREQTEREQEREGLRRRHTALEEESDYSDEDGSVENNNSGSEAAEVEENNKDK